MKLGLEKALPVQQRRFVTLLTDSDNPRLMAIQTKEGYSLYLYTDFLDSTAYTVETFRGEQRSWKSLDTLVDWLNQEVRVLTSLIVPLEGASGL